MQGRMRRANLAMVYDVNDSIIMSPSTVSTIFCHFSEGLLIAARRMEMRKKNTEKPQRFYRLR